MAEEREDVRERERESTREQGTGSPEVSHPAGQAALFSDSHEVTGYTPIKHRERCLFALRHYPLSSPVHSGYASILICSYRSHTIGGSVMPVTVQTSCTREP